MRRSPVAVALALLTLVAGSAAVVAAPGSPVGDLFSPSGNRTAAAAQYGGNGNGRGVGRPDDRPPDNPGKGNPPGQPADRPVGPPGSTTTTTTAADPTLLAITDRLLDLGIEGLLDKGEFKQEYTAPGAGVYEIRGFALITDADGTTRRVLIFSGKHRFDDGGTEKVTVELTEAGRKLLEDLDGAVIISLESSFDPQGAAGPDEEKLVLTLPQQGT
jgi:hypothetical protein